ncbi:MAG: polysaccharide biosynthesis protein [Lachnospiraceae bacterium]|nr:polysaccharide biosynthesis protein [Lachnospiraceae bacterium]
MPSKKKNDGFIMQAGILAVAGIIVRIIGLLYNSPMNAILGDEGMGYYNTAYYAYTIILLISSYSIPSAVSKVIAQKLAVKEYKNAHRIFQCAFIYVLVVGGIASLFVFFGAGLLVQLDNAVLALKVLAPTILLSGILGVLRGYFQAHKTMLQTSVSQILEQILNAVFSILMAYLLLKAAGGIGSEKGLSWGAAGGAIGTGIGVLTALLFMAGVYALNIKTIKRRIARDTSHKDESYGAVFKMILMVVTPFILSTFIYNANTYINQTVYQKIMLEVKGLTDTLVASQTGIVGKAVKVSNIPIALASAMASAMIPGISGEYARGNLKEARREVAKSMKVTMLISIPAAVGIGVLAKPVMWVLYPQKNSIDLSSSLLTVLAVSIVFYTISTLSNAVLQSIGRLNSPVINAAIALLIQTAALIGMLYGLDEKYGPYYYAAAIIIYSFLVCVFNGLSVKKHLNYKQEIDKTFILPIVASSIMGAVAFGVYQGLNYLCKINIVSLAVSVVLAAAVYFLLIIRLGVVTEEELRGMPKGYLLINIAKKTKIMKSEIKSGKKSKKASIKDSGIPKFKMQKEQYESDEDYWLDE